MSSILTDVRKKLAATGHTELSSKEDQPILQEMWDRLQEIREEMNNAKKEAAAQAALPYQEVIEQIEKRYAMMLRLST